MLLPYMNAYGLIPKVFDKIIAASQPERFTQDFLGSKLGFESGSARPIVPLLKKLSFLASDGTPTPLYSKFRNPESRGRAMAQAIRTGYREVFERNEYAHDLPKDKFKNLIVEMTGLEASDPSANLIVNTFMNLKNYANFEDDSHVEPEVKKNMSLLHEEDEVITTLPSKTANGSSDGPTGLNLSYTINLNLPETTDVEVFNAIFRSLKENLLRV